MAFLLTHASIFHFQTISNNETVISKAKNQNKLHDDKGQEYSDDSSDEDDEEESKQSDLEVRETCMNVEKHLIPVIVAV